MKTAVDFHSVGFDWMLSTILLVNPSKRSSFDDAGCPSLLPLGFTIETSGRAPASMSARNSASSPLLAMRVSGLAMMFDSYSNGLQILQYASVGSKKPGSSAFRSKSSPKYFTESPDEFIRSARLTWFTGGMVKE